MHILTSWRPKAGACLAALISGLALAAAFPNLDVWWLAPLGLAPLFLLALTQPPKKAFGAGFLWGLGLYLGQMYWLMVVMTIYGAMAWPLALVALLLLAMYLALYPAALALCLSLFRRDGGRMGWAALLAAPVFWTGLEWVRSFLLTGYPWLPLSGALTSRPEMVQTAEWWGSSGLGFLLALASALFALGLMPLLRGRRPGGREVACLTLAVIIPLAGYVWGGHRLAKVEAAEALAPKAPVTVVQADNRLEWLWRRDSREKVINRHLDLTRKAAQGVAERPWVVVWPESAAPFYFANDARPSQPVFEAARDLDAWICLGSLGAHYQGQSVQVSNRAWLVSPEGRAAGWYDKVHLVPFGEYVPLSDILFFVRAVAQIGDDFAVGREGAVLDAGGVKLGPLICYESIFPELARQMRLAGAQILVNQTQDAWFGRTGAPAQHMSHMVLRSVENRLATARAANTGISAFISPGGRVLGATEIFTQAVETRSLPLMDIMTPFTRWGDLAGPGSAALAVVLLAAVLWPPRRKKGEESDV